MIVILNQHILHGCWFIIFTSVCTIEETHVTIETAGASVVTSSQFSLMWFYINFLSLFFFDYPTML